MSGTMKASAVSALGNLPLHWPEYLMEAGELALYMFATCAFATLLQHPASPVRHLIVNGLFGSAFSASYWHALWIYFIASPLGMLAAAETFLRLRGWVGPACAKLHHANNKRCIFHCEYRTTHSQFFGPSSRTALAN
jgi:hypothetical protein